MIRFWGGARSRFREKINVEMPKHREVVVSKKPVWAVIEFSKTDRLIGVGLLVQGGWVFVGRPGFSDFLQLRLVESGRRASAVVLVTADCAPKPSAERCCGMRWSLR